MRKSRSRNSRDMARGSVEQRATESKVTGLRMAATKSLAGSGKVDNSEAKSSSSKQTGQKGDVVARLSGALGGLGGLLGGAAGALHELGDTRTGQERAADQERLRQNLLASRANDQPVKELDTQGAKFVHSYIPVGKKRLKARGDEGSEADTGMDRHLRLQDLLYGKQDTLGEISAGIRKDQIAIANSLSKDMLLSRVYGKVLLNSAALAKGLEGRGAQNLPQIPIIDFDSYEETFEEKAQDRYDYMRHMNKQGWLEDPTLKQILNSSQEDISGYVDLRDQKAIAGRPWGEVFQKMRDPQFDRAAFFAKLGVEEGMLLLEQLKKETKNMERTPAQQKRSGARTAEKFEPKATQPVVMTYYEPLALCIFALVSKEIQIVRIRAQG